MRRLVMKFGGSSTGSVEALNCAANIVKSETKEWDQIVVVVSAMQGVTDGLIACAEQAARGEHRHLRRTIAELHHKFASTVCVLFAGESQLVELIDTRMAELTALYKHIQNQGHTSPQELAQIAALGERINIHIFSAALRKRGLQSVPVDAADLVITDDCYQSATPIEDLTTSRTKSRLLPLLAEDDIPVVTGFIGATTGGRTTTLGRGGSDYSAAILAASLGADEIWIWTDVDGVMTADPALVPTARLIPEISYNEVLQLASSGAQVLHPKTLLPAKDGNIPIVVKNTFNPLCPGTRIGHCSSLNGGSISSITARFDIKTITFEISDVENVRKIESHLLADLSKRGINVWAIFPSAGYQAVSFAISQKDEQIAIRVMTDSGGNFSRLRVMDDLSLITLIGRDVYLSPQVQRLVARTLDNASIDIKQFGNGNGLHIGVENQAARKALQQIHDRIVLNGHSNIIRPDPFLSHQPAR